MSDTDPLQRLLRLKRYESPGTEYFDRFLGELRDRQRRDGLSGSSLVLVRDRTEQWVQSLGPQKWAIPAGSLAAVVAAFIAIGSQQREDELTHRKSSDKGEIASESQPSTVELSFPADETEPSPATTTAKNKVLPASFQHSLRDL